MGTMPIGSLLAGGLAGLVGAPRTLQLGGLACVVGAVAFARALPGIRAQVRPIYARLGLLPEVVAGLQTATEPGTAARAIPSAFPARSAGPQTRTFRKKSVLMP
jgi:hypothetical protein